MNRSHLIISFTLAVAACFASCTSEKTAQREEEARQRASEIASQPPADTEYRLQAGDTLRVQFFYNPELDQDLIIRPDGKFSLPFIGEVRGKGLSLTELGEHLRELYAAYLKYPQITINVTSFASQVAYVGGEVRNPGVISLGADVSVLQGIILVGGSLTTGDLEKVVIVRDQGTTEPMILMVDLTEQINQFGASPSLTLHPRDIVFVPKTGIAKANQFVREYIRDLLPIQSSFNLQYQFTEFTSLP